MPDEVMVGATGQGGIRPPHKARLPGVLQKIFGGLTNDSVTLPNGQTQYGTDPSQLAAVGSQALPSATAMLGPDVLNPAANSQAPLPSQISQPTFAQANQSQPVPRVDTVQNKALTTKGKVLSVILQAAAGGLEGSQYRNAGQAFADVSQLPFLRAIQQQQVKKQQLENQFSQMQLSQMNTPIKLADGSSIPLWQAMQQGKYDEVQASIAQKKSDVTKNRYVTPRTGGVYDTQTQQFAPGTEPQDKPQNLDQMIAAATQKAISEGRNPGSDPTVQQLTQTKLGATPAAAKTDTPEEQFIDDYRKRNPNASMAGIIRAYSNATKDTTASQNSRSDRSYQFHSNQLDKLGTPVEQLNTRLGRLQDTLAQNSPQADALVAPELLTVMAGGQGSGLRMNEAEISRIVGGRSAWESLKAAANKWQADPSKANSITPAQRQQIRALVNEVQRKAQAKQTALDDARQQLISTDDPSEHKRILARARQQLTSVDQGAGAANSGAPNALDRFWKK
jgi:hypothetical protein